jgi:hypothetical protein
MPPFGTSAFFTQGTMANRYVVRLTNEEHRQLQELVSRGKAAAHKIKHANILVVIYHRRRRHPAAAASPTTQEWTGHLAGGIGR